MFAIFVVPLQRYERNAILSHCADVAVDAEAAAAAIEGNSESGHEACLVVDDRRHSPDWRAVYDTIHVWFAGDGSDPGGHVQPRTVYSRFLAAVSIADLSAATGIHQSR